MTVIRLATVQDAEQILAIYAPFVWETTVSFETDVPRLDEMQARIQAYMTRYPYLVCEDNGQIAGYAYVSSHRGRTAYQWSVESSVYTHVDYRKRGLARRLYRVLFTILRLQGFYNVYAGIARPNPASISFHEAMGFTLLGVYEKIGYKFGAWHDVAWYSLALQADYPENPRAPLVLSEIPADTLTRMLSSGIN